MTVSSVFCQSDPPTEPCSVPHCVPGWAPAEDTAWSSYFTTGVLSVRTMDGGLGNSVFGGLFCASSLDAQLHSWLLPARCQ